MVRYGSFSLPFLSVAGSKFVTKGASHKFNFPCISEDVATTPSCSVEALLVGIEAVPPAGEVGPTRAGSGAAGSGAAGSGADTASVLVAALLLFFFFALFDRRCHRALPGVLWRGAWLGRACSCQRCGPGCVQAGVPSAAHNNEHKLFSQPRDELCFVHDSHT